MAVYGVNTGTFGLSAGKWYWEGKYISGAYAPEIYFPSKYHFPALNPNVPVFTP